MAKNRLKHITFLKNFDDSFESPSITEFRRPTSWTKMAALLATNNSKRVTEEGYGIFSDRASITSPS